MNTIKMLDFKDLFNVKTKHITERQKRLRKYRDLLSINFIQCFLVDKEHINGLEVHCINDKGLIYIYNHKSKKFVTALHPRPSQLKRYYRQLGADIPKEIKRLSRQCYKRNEIENLNNE